MFQDTRELESQLERLQKQVDLFAISSQEIGSSLDSIETRRRAVRLAVGSLAESTLFFSVDPEGQLALAELLSRDPATESRLATESKSDFETLVDRFLIRETVRSGEPMTAVAEGFSFAVPLRERGDITGVFCFIAPLKEGFEDYDRVLMIEFVERVGVALANARLYEDLARAEDKLAEAKSRAEEASRAKSSFLATMSHEIRTPLTAILGFSELLAAQQPANPDSAEFASRIRQNGDHLMRLIDDILNLAKVEAGKVEVEMREIDLAELLANLEAVSRTSAARKGIGFALVLKSPVPATFHSDPTRLNQILSNLVSNAIKFTSQGSVTVEVEFRETSPCLVFRVCDTGPGLTEKQAEKLFMPFSQADSSTTRLFGGTGLGLALSRRLAQLLGGDVELIATRPGVGTTFQVGLPISVSNSTRFIRHVAEGKPAVSNSLAPQSLIGESVLLVDDSEDNRQLVARFLKAAGARVSMATNGFEAIAAASNETFSVVLMDVQMPGMDGLTATRELRKRGYKRPIISLTAHVLEEERRECLLAGCDGHLTKPVQKADLLKSIGEWCSREHSF